MQALALVGLDPIAETLAAPNSYGFRLARSTAAAIGQCFTVLNKRKSPQWILEGDIQSCFDEISHDWLLAYVPMAKALLRQWLKAGFIDKCTLVPTTAGTPQGATSTPPTMLRTLLLWARSIRVRTNTKHDRHFLFINLHASHQRPNNLALHLPIRRGEIPLHRRHKLLSLPDQQSQFAPLYGFLR